MIDKIYFTVHASRFYCISSVKSPQKLSWFFTPEDQMVLSLQDILLITGCVLSFVSSYEGGNTVYVYDTHYKQQNISVTQQDTQYLMINFIHNIQ